MDDARDRPLVGNTPFDAFRDKLLGRANSLFDGVFRCSGSRPDEDLQEFDSVLVLVVLLLGYFILVLIYAAVWVPFKWDRFSL